MPTLFLCHFKRLSLGLVWLVLTLSVSLNSTHTLSQTSEVSDQLPPDVRVVIDISGSMKKNDPKNLRAPALELLVKLLPEKSRAGVWTFGQYINMLVKHRDVDDDWRAMALTKSGDIKSVGLYTNIGQALEKAANETGRRDKNFHSSIILLTDGMVDIDKSPDKNQAEWRRIVDRVLPDLKDQGFTVHTIALSENADTELLQKLALATDGQAAVAKSADDLLKIFLQVFDQAAPSEQVPIDGNRFVVDSSIEEFTALIFRTKKAKPTQLISPDKQTLEFNRERPDVNWYKTDDYDLITVKQPIEGEWLLRADTLPDSRVTVVSDLKLRVKPQPRNLFVDQALPLTMLLQEGAKTINRADFLRLLDINADVMKDGDVTVWSELLSAGLPPGDGIYTSQIQGFSDPGEYQLQVLVDGKSFQRRYQHNVTVREPFSVSTQKRVSNGVTEHIITVSPVGEDVNLTKTSVVAKVKDPSGDSVIKRFELTPRDNWQYTLIPDQQGLYKVALRINGVDEDGFKFGFDPGSLSIRHPDSDDPFGQVTEPDFEEEPEIETPENEESSKADASEAIPEKPPEESSDDSSWILYGALGVGNLVLLVLAFFAYRMIMGDSSKDSLEELEQEIENIDKEDIKETPESSSEDPEMQDVTEIASAEEAVVDPEAQTEALAEKVSEVASDDDLADELLSSDELDVSTDDALADIDSLAGDEIDGIDEPEENALDDDDLDGFSMDDFDDLDDLSISDDENK